MGQHNTIIYNLQLFINNYSGENDLIMACRIFGRITIEDYFEIFKPVIKLGNIAIISKLCNVREIELDVFVTED